MIDFLRKIKQQRIVKQLTTLKRVKKMHNFDSAETIGIIFNVSTEENWKKVTHIVKIFEEYGKKVFLIGKINDKQPLDFLITNINVTLIHSKTDINWLGVPRMSAVKPFVDRKYDVLIDATLDSADFYPMFVALNALADLKVSRGNHVDEEQKVYDLLIKMDSKTSEFDFLKQVIHYLTLINK